MSRDFDEILEEAKGQHRHLEEQYERLRKEYEKYSKEAEIRRLTEQCNDIRRRALVVLSQNERDAIEGFKKIHYERHAPHTKASGSTYIYTLTGTGIGTAISIKCPECGEEKDVTDFSNW